MNDPQTIKRFLHTLRIATTAAVAEYDLNAGDAVPSSGTRFLALAAKTELSWQFPAAGLVSSDGLLVATLRKLVGGKAIGMDLQAVGAIGLETFAGRSVTLRIGGTRLWPAVFDRDGRAAIVFGEPDVAEEDCAAFEVELQDAPR
jgi:hypothetical protein